MSQKAFRTSKLEPKHVATLGQITTTRMTVAQIAAALPLEWPGETQAEHLKRVTAHVSALVDEGLAVAGKTGKGAPDGTYTLAP